VLETKPREQRDNDPNIKRVKDSNETKKPQKAEGSTIRDSQYRERLVRAHAMEAGESFSSHGNVPGTFRQEIILIWDSTRRFPNHV